MPLRKISSSATKPAGPRTAPEVHRERTAVPPRPSRGGSASDAFGSGSTWIRGKRPVQVREAILSSNRALLADSPAGARAKFEKISSSPFSFFRGTADLFYRDLAGTDLNRPAVLCNGDVHPENFGVSKGADGKLSFGLNDFDEAHPAPFSWDVKRGATGFELAARE